MMVDNCYDKVENPTAFSTPTRKARLLYQPREDHSLLTVTFNFLKISIPTIISCIFLELTFLINTVFAGGLNDASKLAGVGLGTVCVNIVCLQPIMGMNGAMETLVSQAYGAKQLRLCGTYLNRGRLINTVIFIPLIVILCFSRPILTSFGQNPRVIDHAVTYISVCIPGVYFQSMFDLKKRFLNCMTISWVPMLAQIGGTVLHVLWCYIFVIYLDMQVVGLGLATAITNVGIFLMITLYAHFLPKIKESLFCFDKSVL